ncbi:MAG: DUF4112 domain-containing protein [Paludibacteraceae bacterium]|nr:DUF4112 domain-containing protein [Paludibacteraceae bacterium]
MSNERRRSTNERLGFDSDEERKIQEDSIKKELKRREEAERISQRIRDSFSYRVLINGAIGFDILDAALGFVEWIGDIVSFVLGLGYVYISASVVRHFRLTIAVLFVLMVDFLLGAIPFVGTVIDVVFPASCVCRSLIQGVVEHDKKKIRLMNIIFFSGSFAVVGLAALVYYLVGYFSDKV